MPILLEFIRTTLILVPLVPCAATSAKSLTTFLTVIGWSGATVTLLGFLGASTKNGRFEWLELGGSIGDPNDFAANLTFLLPAVAFAFMRRGQGIISRCLGLAILGAATILLFRTGSRGCMVTLGVLILSILVVGSVKTRVLLIIGLPLFLGVGIMLAPQSAISRLTYGENTDAEASQEARKQLLFESLRVTGQHPLFGVGPGRFEEYQAGLAAQVNQKGMWHETHNSYTQLSSECGVPAFLAYLCALVGTLREFRRGRKSQDPDIKDVSYTLSFMMISLCTSLFFLAQGYGPAFPFLGGLAIALHFVESKNLRKASVRNETRWPT